MPISRGKVKITSGQPVQLAGTVAAKSIAIAAPAGNKATVYIGSVGTPAGEGFPMEPGDKISLDGGGMEDLWLRGTSGDILHWLAAS